MAVQQILALDDHACLVLTALSVLARTLFLRSKGLNGGRYMKTASCGSESKSVHRAMSCSVEPTSRMITVCYVKTANMPFNPTQALIRIVCHALQELIAQAERLPEHDLDFGI